MKKLIIGALVGGIISFGWQTLSWTALELHRSANQYTPKQDTILQFLNSQMTRDGDYFLPTFSDGASQEEQSRLMSETQGKPWAKISYHKAWDGSMMANIIRGFLVNILMVGFLMWILMKIPSPSFVTILIACLLTGLIAFMQFPYSAYMWYKTGGIRADLTDAIMMWGLCGLWLGWWLRRK